jgi:hypothetical protein
MQDLESKLLPANSESDDRERIESRIQHLIHFHSDAVDAAIIAFIAAMWHTTLALVVLDTAMGRNPSGPLCVFIMASIAALTYYNAIIAMAGLVQVGRIGIVRDATKHQNVSVMAATILITATLVGGIYVAYVHTGYIEIVWVGVK